MHGGCGEGLKCTHGEFATETQHNGTENIIVLPSLHGKHTVLIVWLMI